MNRLIPVVWVAHLLAHTSAAQPAGSVDEITNACREALRQAPLPSHLRGLVYYQDFDHDGECVCDQAWVFKQDVDRFRVDEGRFGKGYRSERPRTNLLTANQASVEQGTDGFVASEGAVLSSVSMASRFGKRALRAEVPAEGLVFRLSPVHAKVKAPYRKTKGFSLSLCIRAETPGVKVRLKLADTFEPEDGGEPKQLAETIEKPCDAVLMQQWQRIAARIELDVKRKEQSLVGSLELLSGAPATIFVDGLQLEQYLRYPHGSAEPTSWIPGGTTSDRGYVDLPVHMIAFGGKEGTLGCWVKDLPTECGGSRPPSTYVSIGSRWYQPVWTIGGRRWYAGDPAKSKYKQSFLWNRGVAEPLKEQGEHRGWHFVALTWAGERIARYIDGQLAGEADHHVPAAPLPSATLRVGGSHLEWFTAESLMDEVFLFNRALPADEVEALAKRTAPLSADLPPALLRCTRTRFLRTEDDASIQLQPVSYTGSPAHVTVTATIPALRAAAGGPATLGRPLGLKLSPWLAEPGRYPLLICTEAQGRRVAFEDAVHIYEEPPSPEYLIGTWGGPAKDIIDLGFTSTMGAAQSLSFGLWSEVRLLKRAWDVLDADLKASCERHARRVARIALTSPNIVACQVNTEIGIPGRFRTDQPYLEWMREEIGLAEIPQGVTLSPLRVIARNDIPADGLLTSNYPPYRFCMWWRDRGVGCWLLNSLMVETAREAGLRAAQYTDCPRPAVPTQFRGMDMVDHWAYPETMCGLTAQISRASCTARLHNVPLRFTPGTIFWDDGSGLWVKDTDGKRKVLCYSPDHLKEIFWLTVAHPTSRFGLYGLGHREKDVWDPGGNKAMHEALHAIRPIGVLVGGLPTTQAPVAILDHDGLLFMRPEGKHKKDYGTWRRHWIMRTVSRVTARTRVPFDWIDDSHVRAGWLPKYEVVVVPSAWCLPKDVHGEPCEFAEKGGTVIVDTIVRAEIPGAVVLPVSRQLPPKAEVEQQLGGWLRRYRDAHRPAFRVEPAESVYTTVREAGPARYLFVVNDHREPGPQYDRFKIAFDVGGQKEPLRDRGLPLDVTVAVPAEKVVYDVLAHERVQTQPQGRTQTFTAQLPAAWAGVYAVLPSPIASVSVTGAAATQPGSYMPVQITICNDRGEPVRGRQLVEMSVTSPKGKWPGVQQYRRVLNGKLTQPLRLPLTAPEGRWSVEAMDWLSGKRATLTFTVR